MTVYDSLSQQTRNFQTLNSNKVTMYVCGITPYDTTHLGHAFLYVFFDTVFRYLTYKGYGVNYTQNVTDIDDDILKRAKKENRDWKELGQFWTEKFLDDLKSLNALSPTHYVKATDSIATIVKIVSLLIERGNAYEKEGSVYFDVTSFPKYGQLSKFNFDQMRLISSERGGNLADSNKKNPLDFILWQKSKDDEPSWDSPWSKGRPGWHIECSAMIKDYLGDTIDIHGGGRDLIYPHHESEIAQSESFTNKAPYVKYWMHVAMVMYQGEKMSKSLGNLVMVSDLLRTYSPNTIRWLLLSHHYRMPWEFEMSELEHAKKVVEEIETQLQDVKQDESTNDMVEKLIEGDFSFGKSLEWILAQVKTNTGIPVVKKYWSLLGFV